MALWGNDDNLVSSGTVALNYSTKTVTGTGTTFGTVGFGVTGDVIRFGSRGSGGVYFGDAIIVSTSSTTSCVIDSTDGLNGDAISGAQYYLSELPKQTTEDHVWSGKHIGAPTYKNHLSLKALEAVGVSSLNIGVTAIKSGIDLAEGDHYLDSPNAQTGTGIEIIGLGTANATVTSASPVGFSTIFAVAPPGVAVGDDITVAVGGVSAQQQLVAIASTQVSIAGTVSSIVAKDSAVTFTSTNVISLASTIANAISSGDNLYFQRRSGGYDKLVYGISATTSGTHDELATGYRTQGGGWVGVTTYIDMHGNLRVKHETLVAMSGIQTGDNGIAYPTPV